MSFHDAAIEQPSEHKNKFGLLSVRAYKVNSKTGASFPIPGVVNQDGSQYNVKGKTLNLDASAKTHWYYVVLLKATDKNGKSYQDIRDDMSWSDAMKIFTSSLKDVFGSSYADRFEDAQGNLLEVPVQIELAPTGEKTNTDKDKTTFKVLRQFSSDAERIIAEKEYFKRFGGQSNGNGLGVPLDIEQKAAGVWQAVNQNAAMFKQLLSNDSAFAPYADALASKFQTA